LGTGSSGRQKKRWVDCDKEDLEQRGTEMDVSETGNVEHIHPFSSVTGSVWSEMGWWMKKMN